MSQFGNIQSNISEHYLRHSLTSHRSYQIYMMPHCVLWEVIVIVSIILHIHLICIHFTFFEEQNTLQLLYYGFEMIFVLHLIFTIFHRNFSIHKRDYCSKKMPFLQLVLGVISVIPYYEIYEYLLNRDPNIIINHLFKFKVILRLVYVIIYFMKKRQECGTARPAYILYETFALNALYICIVSCLFNWLGCYNCDFDNWTIHLKDILYDDNNYKHRIIYPCLLIGGVLLGNYSEVLIPETIAENVIILLTLLIGCIIKINIMLAQLISEYVSTYWRRIRYNMRLANIYNFLEMQKISKHLQIDIRSYFNVFWTKQKGIETFENDFFRLLPSSLRKEVKLDLSWDLLMHSHLFRHTSISVKYAIAKLIKNKFLMKGDIIYYRGDMKSHLVYIVSGIIQVLSEEDDESPIVSFTSGTVIGEIACLLITRSKAKLRCASYCELRVLSLNDVHRKMSNYKHDLSNLQQMMKERIHFARKLHKKKYNHPAECGTLRPIRQMREQWHGIINKKPIVNDCNTSRYLDLMAIREGLGLKVDVVCLTSKCPIIMDPNSSFHELCNIIVIIACLIETALIPYCAAFHREISTSMRTFFIILDFVYIFDIYLQITTAIIDNDIVIVKFSAILLRRIKQLTFLVDCISALPIEYIHWVHGDSPHVFILLKIIRSMKIYKIIRYIRQFERNIVNFNVILVLLGKYYLIWIVCVYFFTCLFYVMSCFTEECYEFGWYLYNKQLSKEPSLTTTPLMTSLLFVVDILSSAKRNFYTFTLLDGLISFALVIIGYYLIPFCIAEITATEYWDFHEASSNKFFIKSVLTYAHIHKLNNETIKRLANLLTFQWEYSRGLFNHSADEFLSQIPPKLETRIRKELVGWYLDREPLFQNLDERIKQRIVKMALLVSYPKGEIIALQNQLLSHIHIIRRGHCKQRCIIPGDVQKNTNVSYLTKGACFPIVEVMQKVPSFITVTTLTAVDTIVIPYEQFFATIHADRKYYGEVCRTLKDHMEAHRLTLTRAQMRLTLDIDFQSIKSGIYFKYKIDDQITIEETKPNILFRTIDPHNRFYIAYEIIRCVLATFQLVILCLQMNILYEYRNAIQKLHITCDILSWVDIFIRMHVHYYREDGIIVTDFKTIAKHYFRHSFALDLYASCPFSTMSLDTMITKNHQVVIKQMILLLSRPFQLYRLLFGIYYWCNTKQISKVNAVRIQYLLFIMIILPVGSNLLMLWACDIDNNQVTCPMNGWQGGNISSITPASSLAHYSYSTSLYMSGYPSNHYAENANRSYTFYVLITIISLSIVWCLMSKLISFGLHGEFMTLDLQNARTHFKRFAKKEGVNFELVQRLLRVNEFLSRDVQVNALSEAEKRMPPQLFRDVCYALNKSALAHNNLLGFAPSQIQRTLAFKFKRNFYMKDDAIIRNNDINEFIYIVKVGRVEISIAGYKVISLTRGGMFGCVSDKKCMRQTIDAIATIHTEVIYISSTTLNCNIMKYDFLKSRMHNLTVQNLEYVDSIDYEKKVKLSPLDTMSSKYNVRFLEQLNRILDQNIRNRSFNIFNYIINVHLSAISVIYIMIYQLAMIHEYVSLGYMIVLYILDILFLVKLCLGLTLPYVDKISGCKIQDARKIMLRYLKKDFPIDLLLVIPFELLMGSMFTKPLSKACLTANRLFRIFYLLRYYRTHRKENKLTHHLRWTFLVYIMIIYIQFFTNVWNLVACYEHTCYYIKFVSYDDEEYIPSLTYSLSLIHSYMHVINTFTGVGLRVIKPLSVSEIVITFWIVVSSIFMMATICSGFAFIQMIDNYKLGKFNIKLKSLETYLKILRLSPAIVEKVVEYYTFLWKVQDGEQWPDLIRESNRYLKEDIMLDLYSEMFLNHVLFKKVHKDFVRQLVVHLKRCVYPRSYVIVEQHEVDGKMYFVQSGEVGYIDNKSTAFKIIGTYTKGHSFGEVEGLTMHPHKYTYFANTQVVILSLRRSDWQYLFDYYPATLNEIKAKLLQEYNARF